MTASTRPARPCCSICSFTMSSDEETVQILGETFHADCADEHNEEILEREREAGIFEGMDVRSDDNACDMDF